MSLPVVTPEIQCMKRLWVHECLRVFSDRLVEEKDRQWLVTCLRDATSKYLNDDFDRMLSRLLKGPNDKVLKLYCISHLQ